MTNAGTKTNKPGCQAPTLSRSQLEPKPGRARDSQTRTDTSQDQNQKEVHRPQAINLGGPGSGQAGITRAAHSRPTVTAAKKPNDGEAQSQGREPRDTAEETTSIQRAKGKDSVVTDTPSRTSTSCPEQSEDGRLLITQNIHDATNRNETNSENTERDIRVEDLPRPREGPVEMVRMVPNNGKAAGVRVKVFQTPAGAQNKRAGAQGRRRSPNRVNITQPTPDKKLVVNINNGSRRAVVRTSGRQQGPKGAHGFPHGNPQRTESRRQTTRERRRRVLNNPNSRRRKKKSQKTRERKRLWGVKTPWRWRVPQTRSRRKDKTEEKPADPVRSEMITADGTMTGSTVNVHNTNKRVKCVKTPMDKTESVVSNITAGRGSKSSGKSIRKRQETLDANEKQEDIDIPCVIR